MNVVRVRQSSLEGDKVDSHMMAEPGILKLAGFDNDHSSRRLAEAADCSQHSWPKRKRKAGKLSVDDNPIAIEDEAKASEDDGK